MSYSLNNKIMGAIAIFSSLAAISLYLFSATASRFAVAATLLVCLVWLVLNSIVFIKRVTRCENEEIETIHVIAPAICAGVSVFVGYFAFRG